MKSGSAALSSHSENLLKYGKIILENG